jgi:serine/threonine protein kinase
MGSVTEVRAGLVLGRYELLVPIASGGMAQVWAARLRGARQFQKIVAVKTMLPKLSEDEQFEQMFLDEASLASQVRHPNAVEILDLGEQSGVLYLVMEWIEGAPLNQLMKAAKADGGMPHAIAARIALQACSGLHAAHELKDEKGQLVGLVHRDVSPQNLLVTYDGVTKVVDFGVAKATALGGGATVAGQVKGKVSYMAPEQVNGEGLDRRADIFALGIVLYALTTGKHPFRRESEAATMYNICSPEPVVAPSRVRPDFPKELEPILLKALEKDREKRFSSCDEMLRALDSLPSHLRVGSDADVAAFVNRVLSGTRAAQRARIDDAIARADTAGESGLWSGPDVSQVRTGTGATGTFEITGVPTGLDPVVVRNRILGGVGLAALVAAGSVLATLVLRSPPASPPEEVSLPEAPLAPPPVAPASPIDLGGGLSTDEPAKTAPRPAKGSAKPSAAPAKPGGEVPTSKPAGSATTGPAAEPAAGSVGTGSGTTGAPTSGAASPGAASSGSSAPANDNWKSEAGF